MTPRAAIYARFSSDNQDERSIEGQILFCRETIAPRHACSIVLTFTDAELSGRDTVNRPGFQALMAAAESRAFDCILIEDFDRFVRDQADWHTARKQLDFLGIKIIDSYGVIGRLDGSFRAMMAEHHIDNLIVHTRRGMALRVRDGFVAGGLTYGYDIVPGGEKGERGGRTINEDEAAIVRRIFAEYIAGRRPFDIVKALNRDHIKPPRGRDWRPSTLLGSAKRCTGILNNPLYDGRLVWNRLRYVKNPYTKKRVSRLNPESEWQTTAVEQLRIIDPESFAAAQRIKAERTKVNPSHRRKPKHLLSGLMTCGCCGGSMIIRDKIASGRRIACSRAKDAGTCAHARPYSLEAVTRRVVSGLREILVDTRAIEAYAETYRAERKRLAASEAATERRRERRMGELDREIKRWSDAFGKGEMPAEIAGPKIKDLSAERERLRAESAAQPANVVALHPAAIAHYLGVVNALAEALRDGEIGDQAAQPLRSLIARVTVTPAANGGAPALDIAGRLAELMQSPTPGKAWGFEMVAGAGFEPATFRL